MDEYDPDWDYTTHARNGSINPTVTVRCVACNRPLSVARHAVIVAPSGLLVEYTGEALTLYGAHPIGPECSARVPQEYIGLDLAAPPEEA